jgi:hypothetical protein
MKQFRYHMKQHLTPPEFADILQPYITVLIQLTARDEMRRGHPLSTLSHPPDTIKQALLAYATTVQDEDELFDLGMMYTYLGLFLPDEDLATKPLELLKERVKQQILTYREEYISSMKQHNPYFTE